MSSATLIDEFPKNTRERVRVSLTEYGGYKLVDVRAFYEDACGEWKPGKGLTLRRELLPNLKRALLLAERAAKNASQDA